MSAFSCRVLHLHRLLCSYLYSPLNAAITGEPYTHQNQITSVSLRITAIKAVLIGLKIRLRRAIRSKYEGASDEICEEDALRVDRIKTGTQRMTLAG